MDSTVAERPEASAPTVSAGVERRKGNRLRAYWDALRGERRCPSLPEIDLTAIATLWRYCFLAAVSGERLQFTYVGPAATRGYGIGGAPTAATAIPPALLKLVEDPCREAVQSMKPVLFEGVTANGWGDEVRYRSVALPLSPDQVAASHLLGLIDYVELRRSIADGIQVTTAISPDTR